MAFPTWARRWHYQLMHHPHLWTDDPPCLACLQTLRRASAMGSCCLCCVRPLGILVEIFLHLFCLHVRVFACDSRHHVPKSMT